MDSARAAELIGTRSLEEFMLKVAALEKNWRAEQAQKNVKEIRDNIWRSGKGVVGSGHGYALIHAFARMGHESGVRLLLEKGADIEARDRFGISVLFQAIRSKNESLVRFLLENGSNLEAKSDTQWSALHVAVDCGCESIVILLLKKGAGINEDDRGSTPLHVFARNGICNERILTMLLEKGAKIDASVLKKAMNNEEMVALLKRYGGSLDDSDVRKEHK